METEDRWYVRFRGHTLGPLTSEQVKASVRGKELGPDDKLASTSNPTWRALRTQAEFLRYWETLQRPLPVELTPLPSPTILWQKKRTALPVAPAQIPTTTSPEEPKAVAAASPSPPVKNAQIPIAAPVKVKNAEKPASAKAKASRAKKAAPKAKAKTKKAAPAQPKAKKEKARAESAKPAPSPMPAATPAPEPEALPPAQSAAPALAGIPEKPAFNAPSLETSLEPAAPSPSPKGAETIPQPQLAEETLSLLEALRDWNRKEQGQAQAREAALPQPAFSAPTKAPVALPVAPAAPLTQMKFEAEPTPLPAGNAKSIELKLNLTISKQFLFITAALSAVALAALVFGFSQAQKMRGPADSRLPDPSSPTATPSAENDPIPQLKAPTRPKRD